MTSTQPVERDPAVWMQTLGYTDEQIAVVQRYQALDVPGVNWYYGLPDEHGSVSVAAIVWDDDAVWEIEIFPEGASDPQEAREVEWQTGIGEPDEQEK